MIIKSGDGCTVVGTMSVMRLAVIVFLLPFLCYCYACPGRTSSLEDHSLGNPQSVVPNQQHHGRWGLVRDAVPAPRRPGSQHPHSDKVPRWPVRTVKFEKHG